jgi:hypothetical protein
VKNIVEGSNFIDWCVFGLTAGFVLGGFVLYLVGAL